MSRIVPTTQYQKEENPQQIFVQILQHNPICIIDILLISRKLQLLRDTGMKDTGGKRGEETWGGAGICLNAFQDRILCTGEDSDCYRHEGAVVLEAGRRLKTALFPCVGSLRNGPRGDHVQKVLALTFHSRRRFVGR